MRCLSNDRNGDVDNPGMLGRGSRSAVSRQTERTQTMTDNQTHSLSELDQSDTMDPQEAEMATHPQPNDSDAYVRFSREQREDAKRAMSRRRVPL